MCYDLLRFSLCFKICAFSTSPPLFPFPFCLCGISVAALFGYGVPCELWFSGRLKEAVGRLIFCSRALVQSSRAPLFACRDSTSWFSSERAANNQPFFCSSASVDRGRKVFSKSRIAGSQYKQGSRFQLSENIFNQAADAQRFY